MSIKEIIKKILLELPGKLERDQTFMGAAALGYYLLLATFPAIISLISMTPYLPTESIQAFVDNIFDILPSDAAQIVLGIIKEVAYERSPGIISSGFVVAIWVASSGAVSIISQVNIANEVNRKVSFVNDRILAIGLTFLYSFIIIAVVFILTISEKYLFDIKNFLSSLFSSKLLSFVILNLGFSTIYFFSLKAKKKFKLFSIGSVIGAILLVISTDLFGYYVANFADYGAIYGSMGGIVTYMLWLYISGFSLLIGTTLDFLYEKYK